MITKKSKVINPHKMMLAANNNYDIMMGKAPWNESTVNEKTIAPEAKCNPTGENLETKVAASMGKLGTSNRKTELNKKRATNKEKPNCCLVQLKQVTKRRGPTRTISCIIMARLAVVTSTVPCAQANEM
jgi:hypothetical protein